MSALMRKATILLSGLALLFPVMLKAESPAGQFTGTWELNAQKSQVTDGRAITLTLQETPGQVKFERVARKGNDTVTTTFGCGTAGTECEVNEGSHKSKVSLWYNGRTLNLCKTNGPEGEVVSEWKMEVSPDGKTLTVTISHIDPAGNDETLVFDRKNPT